PAMLRNPSINEQCTSCHADKRGPYVFEHPPVEENCASCHNPHGSSHSKLLHEHTPNLCQECHEGSRHPRTDYGSLGRWLDRTARSSTNTVTFAMARCRRSSREAAAAITGSTSTARISAATISTSRPAEAATARSSSSSGATRCGTSS